MKADAVVPTRSQSVGSLMELGNPAERRIKDLITDELKAAPIRKLESTVSTDQANILNDRKRKDKIVKEHTVADISVRGGNKLREKAEIAQSPKEMEVEDSSSLSDPSLQGAACVEILEEAKKIEKKPVKTKRTLSTNLNGKMLEEINEHPSQENLCSKADKENKEEGKLPEESKISAKRKVIKKKVLTDKNDIIEKEQEKVPMQSEPKISEKEEIGKIETVESQENEKNQEEKVEEAPPKQVERRRSRIFEQAEKFQNMISNNETKPTNLEKPKKIVIPGVSVGGYKKEFERKASLTSTSPPKVKTLTKKPSVDKSESKEKTPEKTEAPKDVKVKPEVTTPITPPQEDEERKQKVKNAVNIISNALSEGARKSKSRPCMRKPPVPFGAGGRSASGSIGMISSPLSPPPDPKFLLKFQQNQANGGVKPEVKKTAEGESNTGEGGTKSATLPRRKTTKAEITLEYPQPKSPNMEFKTEMAHRVEAPPKLPTQRSEVIFPVHSPPSVEFRYIIVE